MRAIQLTSYGGPETLVPQDLPRPVPAPNEILVRIEAIGLNYVDTHIRKGSHPILKQFPTIMPGEIEGIIETTGEAVRHFQPGQRITGYAQADNYTSLLVTAAAGGVGSSVLNIARLKGITPVIGLVGSEDKLDYVLSLGADQAFVYGENDWLAHLDRSLENKGIDLILDSVGGQLVASLLPRLARGGALVVYGNSSGQPSVADISSLIMSNARILSARLYAAPIALREQWAGEIIQWIREGRLDPAITAYPLADAARAHRDLEERRTIGRLILQP